MQAPSTAYSPSCPQDGWPTNGWAALQFCDNRVARHRQREREGPKNRASSPAVSPESVAVALRPARPSRTLVRSVAAARVRNAVLSHAATVRQPQLSVPRASVPGTLRCGRARGFLRRRVWVRVRRSAGGDRRAARAPRPRMRGDQRASGRRRGRRARPCFAAGPRGGFRREHRAGAASRVDACAAGAFTCCRVACRRAPTRRSARRAAPRSQATCATRAKWRRGTA